MARPCSICQHVRRADIDRRLAAGEPAARIARDYGLTVSSVRRHRVNCTGLPPAGAVAAAASQARAALATLPTRDELGAAYQNLQARTDQIVARAEQSGSLAIAINGLRELRSQLDSISKLAGHTDKAEPAQVSVQVNVGAVVQQIMAAIGPSPTDAVLARLERLADD